MLAASPDGELRHRRADDEQQDGRLDVRPPGNGGLLRQRLGIEVANVLRRAGQISPAAIKRTTPASAAATITQLQ